MGHRHRRGSGPTPDVVFLVIDRDQERCVRCYQPCRGLRGWDWSIQHRIPRGMGGTSRPELNAPGNLIVLCGSGTTGCHGHIETTVDGRREALENGWAVSKFVKDPKSIPVSLWDANGQRVSVFLDDDGGTHNE